MTQELPLVSVVAPVLDEEEGIEEFHARLVAVLERIEPAVAFDIVLVDDGSADGTPELLGKLCEADDRVRVVTLSRTFGHQAAITAGLDHATGDAVVVIDADLQDPPEVVAEFVDRWRAGCHVVYGVRANRLGERRSRLFVTRRFYRFLNRISDTPIPLDTGDFRLMDRAVVDVLAEELRESNRYLRGLVSWVGFRQCAVAYERDPRHAGTAKYTAAKLAKLALDGITSFSVKPLLLSFRLGLVVVLLALAYAAVIVVQRLAFPDSAPEGWASVMVAVLLLGGVQLISVGLLGEYIGRVYRETKRRPLYVVAGRRNLEPPARREA